LRIGHPLTRPQFVSAKSCCGSGSRNRPFAMQMSERGERSSKTHGNGGETRKSQEKSPAGEPTGLESLGRGCLKRHELYAVAAIFVQVRKEHSGLQETQLWRAYRMATGCA
jgi:hypothetical protein